MLNITTISRQQIGSVVSYYTDSADDYYAKDGSAMQWHGKAAETLGLDGHVDQSRFHELMRGHIDDQTQLRRVKLQDMDKERLGYDLTFSAPKGVSLQALVHGDQRIIDAHDKAVAAAVKEAEGLAMARSTTQGKTSIEETGNLAVAAFRHETSRELDPQLHTHGFVMNLTQRKDGEWRALTNDRIVNSLSHLGNVYRAELAKELHSQGFQLRYDKNGTFDLAHFSREQVDHFSQRSQQIEKALAEKGLDRGSATQAEKNQLSLATRRKKDGNVDREVLREVWQERSREAGIDYSRKEWAGAGYDPKAVDRQSMPTNLSNPREHWANESVKFAIEKNTERQAIVTTKQLEHDALTHGQPVVSITDIRAAIERRAREGHLIKESDTYRSMNQAGNGRKGKSEEGPALTRAEWTRQVQEDTGRSKAEARRLVDQGIEQGRLFKAEPRYTTQIAMQRERDILRMERQGRGGVAAVAKDKEVDRFLERHSTLSKGQRESVQMIGTSTNRFTAVQGYAGVGKSFMTTTAKELLEDRGYQVQGVAMYNSQVGNLKNEGIDSQTVAAFLKASEKNLGPKSVVFLDEAGVVPARQMRDLMKEVDRHGARLVMLGDISQTKAIESGKPMEQLMKAGMQTSRMDEIQRQKSSPELLKAVQFAAEGKTGQSLGHLKSIQEVPVANERHFKMAQDFMALPAADREKSIVLTGTNKSRQEINGFVREMMGLKGTGKPFELMHRDDSTQPERKDSRYYQKGQIIVPEKDYKVGLVRGEQYRIIDNGPGNKLTVTSSTGEQIQFNPSRASKLSVYRVDKQELAKGDQVKIQRNVANLDLRTGERFTVRDVSSSGLLMENDKGRVVKLDNKGALPLSYGYSTTVHSSQGLTEDRIFVNLDSKSRTSSKEVYYVAISRARHEANVYTDSREKLPAAVSKETEKSTALDLKQLQRHLHEHENGDRDRKQERDDRGFGGQEREGRQEVQQAARERQQKQQREKADDRGLER
ncbi:MobF family relaxase [Salinicola sp. NYA28a]